ncbi:hypothetical protein [Haliscomenobacter hydrossis]|uniref:Uncharacterized protein n=1 Tax=Haliscomenobacter hydrossis (strain ATCC 27775 / DSM 1100 / LMG 10767 / O) TaxID=760192 RepID=F4L576_HALH1|nr:hypothetical protein [Haliscomenobacter hydrossis]AEE49756.1 hypothetical protein Halhy_1871 [Haliscomenobacter hydrossis DSM 1100]
MTSVKKKKGGSVALPKPAPNPSSNAIPAAQNNRVDDEPKVSFTLEFYAVNEQDTAFVGRLKKIGSDEQVALIDGLDIESIDRFIRHNLPKTWILSPPVAHPADEVAFEIGLRPAAANRTLPNSTAELLVSGAKPMPTNAQGKIEVWQNGRQNSIVQAGKNCLVCFEVEEQPVWAQFSAHFKSLEPEVPSFQFSKYNEFTGKPTLELYEGQLKPGIYSLMVSAAAKTDAPQGTVLFTADRLVQVI